MKSCAIVILNYNGEETMATFLPSVIENSSNDIWVIDNNSTDESLEFLKQNYPQILLLQSPENFGFAGGYNWGLDQLKGKYKYYILLNSDVEVTKSWDESLIENLELNPDFSAFQPKILSWKNKSLFDYAGAGGGFLDSFGYPFCRGRIWDSIETDSGQYDDEIQVDWSSGACMILRAEVFHHLGGFDSDFFAHMEEIDLCWRMRKSGWKIGYSGKTAVYHLGGATLDRGSPKKLYLNIRNSLSMIYKNVNGRSFTFIYVVKFFLENFAAWSYLLNGQKPLAQAIWKGYSDFKAKKRKILKTESSKNETPSKSPVRFIFWNWKILGKKSFQEL
ncbi:glycosyltransferase family 2 protein [Algoriphagus marinus]|uniref:glycosyltransferase family 2 protein n=1 Tax=Algoriphagus marinus TaxID=1925762 RepID=UPI00094BC1B6|nr:glycosyltransferase family 2 protein [Algoriphagus marinus]